MGCVQSVPYVPDGAPVETISFRRQSGRNKRAASKKLRNKAAQGDGGEQTSTAAALSGNDLAPGNETCAPDLCKTVNEGLDSNGAGTPQASLFKRKFKHSNELSLSVDSMEAVDMEVREKKRLHRKGLFPAWKKYDRCTFCVKVATEEQRPEQQQGDTAPNVDEKSAMRNTEQHHHHHHQQQQQQEPWNPKLCRQCSGSLLANIQNNLRLPHAHHHGVNMAIANLLAVTALDLTAPASDALLKNRKNAWIQVAGHPGSFAPAGPNTIWKKRIEKENYETKTYQALMEESLRDMVPKFHREVEYNGEYFIEMEDLLQHFSDPSIMDIKMGKRTFLELEVKNPVLRKDLYEKMVTIDPDAPTEEEREQEAITKLRYMQFREQESSTADLGFRIEAIRMSGEPPNTNLKKTKTKEQVAQVMLSFFKGRYESLVFLLARLKEIREKFENSKFFKDHEIIGSSLLIMYDHNKASAWMIDFAKTIPVDNGLKLDHRSPWKIGSHEDGYLAGLDNLIMIVESTIDGRNQLILEDTSKEVS